MRYSLILVGLLLGLQACRTELQPSNLVQNGDTRIAFLNPAPHSVHQGDTVWLQIEVEGPTIEYFSLRILRDGMSYFETPAEEERVNASNRLLVEKAIILNDEQHRHFEVSAMTWNSDSEPTEALLFFHTKH